tara:strand:+ start:256 stop:582 length:327 start_codon:yes stop_codon:yes gene_type:complete
MKKLNKQEKEMLKTLDKARDILRDQRGVLYEKRQEFCNGIVDREIEFECIAEEYDGEQFRLDICDDGARYLLEQNHDLQSISGELLKVFSCVFEVIKTIDPDYMNRKR